MPNYTNLAATAQRLITKFGMNCTVVRETAATYNPVTNAQTRTEASSTVKGVRLEFGHSRVDGEAIKQGDLRCFLEAVDLTFVPQKDDHVTFGSVKYNIERVMEISPGGTPVYYDLQLRV